MAATLLGVKCIGFAAVTNPASGTVDHWVHDGEANIIAAGKCLQGLRKVIWNIVSKFEFNPSHKLTLNYTGMNSLRLRQVHGHLSSADIVTRIVSKVKELTQDSRIPIVHWFMSGDLL
jgi:hypothetical protein